MFWKGFQRLLALTALSLILSGCTAYPFKYEPYTAPHYLSSDDGDHGSTTVIV